MKKIIKYFLIVFVIAYNIPFGVFASENIMETKLIEPVKITKVADGVYMLEAHMDDSEDIENIQYSIYTTKNGKDDIEDGNIEVESNVIILTVNNERHNYEYGEYKVEIYVNHKNKTKTKLVVDSLIMSNFDDVETNSNAKKIVESDDNDKSDEIRENNKISIFALNEETILETEKKAEDFSITNVEVQQFQGRYRITVTVTSSIGLDRVQFPTWTTNNGMEDITWHEGTIKGNTVTYTVDMKDHGYETGQYNTHIYAYDKAGNMGFYAVPAQEVHNEAPIIGTPSIIEEGQGYYTLECFVEDDYEIDYVNFAVWSEYKWQDDIQWQRAEVQNGKARITVYAKNHNYESGRYITHIYAYDKAGLYSFKDGVVSMQAPSMQEGWKVINGHKYLFNTNGEVVKGANKLIIDISEHNGDIDWEKVKSSGVDGVILRCGYGWADDLDAQMDKKFLKNAMELERLGIPYGVYLFSYENSSNGALREAEYTLELIRGRTISLPVYYDLEYSNYAGNISQNTYVAMAKAYCNKISEAGYTAGIYANLNYWNNKLNDSSLDKYVKWIAQYNSNNGQAGHCDYTKTYKMWQYTSVGHVPGVNGNVDMNALF